MVNTRKRARTQVESEGSDPNNASATRLTRHPDLWFDDGSIVLSAGTTLFRVHRSTLSTHSTVFADMFRLPQPHDQDAIEGCPVVHISDSVQDVVCLLKALYDPFYFAGVNENGYIPFDDIAGVLRLSTKYDIQTFRHKSIQELKKFFPCTLTNFDTSLDPTDQEIVQAIILGRECNAPEILPVAFYLFCHIPTRQKLDASFTADLPRHEIDLCIIACDKLAEVFETETFSHVYNFTISQDCQTKNRCEQVGLRILRNAISQRLHVQCPTLEAFGWDDFKPQYCNPCIAAIKSAFVLRRQKVWNDLPSYFGLGTWEELRNAQGC